VIALAAVAQVFTTCSQWQVMDETMKMDQQAWIGVTSKDMMVLMPGTPLKAKVVLRNSGKTPAINVKTFGKLIQVTERLSSERFEITPLPKDTESGSALAPNAESRSIFIGDTPKLQMIRDSKIFVYFYGKITYQDVFKNNHLTKFCGVYDIDENAFVNCGGYSEVN
jgi:hypothetical protein